MSRMRESPRSRNRSVSYRTEFNLEIEQRIVQLRRRMVEVRDLMVDGFPYKDSERVRLELQIRQAVRQAFGDGSPEYQRHQYFRLKPNDLEATIAMMKDLIGRLEKQKFDLPDDLQPTPLPITDAVADGSDGPPAVAFPQAAPASTGAGRQAPRAQTSMAATESLLPGTAAESVQPGPARQPGPQPAVGKPGPIRSSESPMPSPQSAASRARSEPIGTSRAGGGNQRAASQQPATNARATIKRGELAMIANKPRHDGTEPGRETRAESWADDSPPDLAAIRRLCTGFHAVARQLRQRHDDRATLDVEDEHDVQDLFHALLRLEFQDIRTERWEPSYAGGDERTTFLLGPEGLAMVIKRTKPGLGGRELKMQLDIDAQRYSGRQDCQTLLCFVYDPEGRIANPREFEASLTQEDEGRAIAVQISP